MRILRALTLTALGFWAGMAAAASVVKRAVPSRGDVESDEVALVAIFDGVVLKSRAKSFRGGSMFSWLEASWSTCATRTSLPTRT